MRNFKEVSSFRGCSECPVADTQAIQTLHLRRRRALVTAPRPPASAYRKHSLPNRRAYRPSSPTVCPLRTQAQGHQARLFCEIPKSFVVFTRSGPHRPINTPLLVVTFSKRRLVRHVGKFSDCKFTMVDGSGENLLAGASPGGQAAPHGGASIRFSHERRPDQYLHVLGWGLGFFHIDGG
jgi:hypothetical protein